MPRTVFILGTDSEYCAQLQGVLQAQTSDTIVIVTPSTADSIPRQKESDTIIIISGETGDIGEMYRHLLNRLEAQANRVRAAGVLAELVRLSMTLSLEETLKKVLEKSTEVLGDAAFIVLESDARYQLETTFCVDANRLTRMLMTAVNISLRAVASELLRAALDKGEPVVVANLSHVKLVPELRLFVDKHELFSMIVTPIRGKKDRTLGAFISLSTAPKMLIDQDMAAATELADFTAMVIENARAATTDQLTGLHNRRFFDEVLNREVARSHRYLTPLWVLMIDVDNFKVINDTYGHDIGDQVLIQIGRILEECVRNTDFVCRYGGDEFGVVLPSTGVQGALRAAKMILARVQSSDILRSLARSGTTTVSIGIAEYKRGSSSETLVSQADQALIDAKRSGKNTIRIFNEDQKDSKD
jgi:diguanylate cyclase (GGDEF)-like protein